MGAKVLLTHMHSMVLINLDADCERNLIWVLENQINPSVTSTLVIAEPVVEKGQKCVWLQLSSSYNQLSWRLV